MYYFLYLKKRGNLEEMKILNTFKLKDLLILVSYMDYFLVVEAT